MARPVKRVSPVLKDCEFSETRKKGPEFLEAPLAEAEVSTQVRDPAAVAFRNTTKSKGPYPDLNLNTEMTFINPAALLALAVDTLWPRCKHGTGYTMGREAAEAILGDAAAMAQKSGLKNWQIIETKLAMGTPDERFGLCLDICANLTAAQFTGILMACHLPPDRRNHPEWWL